MRLDIFLFEKGFAVSRERAKKLISDERVCVNQRIITKPSFDVCESDIVTVEKSQEYEYVSRGGYKLQAALEAFDIDVSGLCAADLGASSGGFCDCLLLKGAKKVFAVDCGSGQLVSSIRDDNRVISLENTNARYITDKTFGEKVDIVVMDLSFISQTLVFPAVSRILKDGGILVSLIKPQFEVGKSNIGKNGIVKDKKATDEAVRRVVDNAAGFGLCCRGTITSPIKGGDGNTEYLAVFDFDLSKNKNIGSI